MITVYHNTDAESAAAIRSDGFRDNTGTYGTGKEVTGVFVADQPWTWRDRGPVQLVLTLSVDEEALVPYEWVQPGYAREWCIPAALLNKWRVEMQTESDDPDEGWPEQADL